MNSGTTNCSTRSVADVAAEELVVAVAEADVVVVLLAVLAPLCEASPAAQVRICRVHMEGWASALLQGAFEGRGNSKYTIVRKE